MYFTIEAEHPSLPGHFPGHPVVPGVVILSYVMAALRTQPNALRIVGIRRLKFLRQVLPGQTLRLVIESPKTQPDRTSRMGFECWLGEAQVLSGVALVVMSLGV